MGAILYSFILASLAFANSPSSVTAPKCTLLVQVTPNEEGYERPVIRFRVESAESRVSVMLNKQRTIYQPPVAFEGMGLLDLSDPASIERIVVKHGKEGPKEHCEGSPFDSKKYLTVKTFDGIYKSVLGRAPASSDYVSGWMDKDLEARKKVLRDLVSSKERRMIELTAYMNQFIREETVTSDVEQLERAAKNLQGTLVELLSGQIYFIQSGSTEDAFLRSLYNDLIKSDPIESEYSMLLEKLKSGSNRNVVAQFLIGKSEFRTRLVQSWWQDYLGREPTEEELNWALQKLEAGTTWEDVQVEILSTEEFNQKTLSS